MSQVEPEAPLEGTPPVEEPVPPVLEEEQPRDPDTGRFVPTDPRAAQVLDKYGGDVDKALAAAAEAQELIGRQGSELGELREWRTQVEQQQALTPPDQILAYAEHDPQQAALMAYQQYGRQSMPYQQAMRSWMDMDPYAAGEFNTQAAMADYDRQIRPQLAEQQLSAGLNQIIAKYPDFQEYGDAILREAQNSPVVRALQQQGAPIGADVIEHLYLAAKGRAATAQSQTQAHDATLARQQKLEAGVASATAARPGEPPPVSEDDAFKAEFAATARQMGYGFIADE
jgi:hypothetical protein